MNGPLYKFFVEDHRRLEKLLNRATANEPNYEMEAYSAFRGGLLKHIKMEENILIPAAQKARDGKPLAIAQRIRLDHGALVALLVPPPSPIVIRAFHAILAKHNQVEEEQGGLYDLCERLAGTQIDQLMTSLENVQDVPVLPLKDEPIVMEAAKRALARAGYNMDDFAKNGTR
jgi:hypothetical protein